jgi:PAS domain S-box-containing protein
MKKNLNVLVIEDSATDAELNVRMLMSAGYEIFYKQVETAGQMEAQFERTFWDLVLSDYSMPQFTVEEALEIYKRQDIDIPFIIISGTIGEEKAVQLIKEGVHNCLLKDNMTRFIPIVKRELLEAQNRRELVNLNVSLAISENKYRSYIDHAPDCVFLTDETGRYMEVNDATCRSTGYSEEELLGMSFFDILPVESIKDAKTQYSKLTKAGSLHTDLSFRHKNGTIHWWDLEAVQLSNDKFLGFAKEITRRKHAEALLEQTRQNYDSFFNTIDDFLFVLDVHGNIVHANSTVFNRLGYTRENLIGKSILSVHPADRREEAGIIVFEMLTGKLLSCLVPLVTKSGVIIEVETKVSHGFWNGKPAIFGVTKDITKLRLSEEKFSKLFHINPSACGLSSLTDDSYLEVNEAFYSLLGFSKNEVIGKTASELGILSPEMRRSILSLTDKDGSISNAEADLVAKNGDVKHVLLSAQNILMQSEKYRYTVVHDITKRKLAEEKLQESEERFRVVAQSANDAIISINSSGDIISWNRGAENIFGYSESEIIGQQLTAIMPAQYAQKHQFSIERVLNGGTAHILGKTVELSASHKSGLEFPVEISLASWETSSGTFYTGIIRDITGRKQAEEQMRRAYSFLNSIIENIPDMIVIKDAETLNFVSFNKAGENLLGIPKGELVGRNDYDIFPTEFAESYMQTDREALRSRKMMDIPEEFVETKLNGLRLLHTYKIPIFDSIGEPEYLLCISEDITELKIAEEARKISEEKYKTMLDASPDGILLTNLQGIITEASEIGLELFGADSRDDLVGKNFYRFIPSTEKKKVKEIIERTLNEGLAQNIELTIRKKNQAFFSSETSTTLLQDAAGAPLSFMIIVRDISQRKKTETKQMHADRMANLGEMASGIAHEINQPLNIISLVLDKILSDASRLKKIDIAFLTAKSDKIFENITRIRNIIDHVRAFSRSNNDYILTAFDVNKSIGNAVSMISEQFKHLGINLNLQLDQSIPQITGNTYKFEQVIINLLVNSKDAVIDRKNQLQEGEELHIGIRTYSENNMLMVELKDNGIGISKDDINNIWLPFYTTKDEAKGTGLGLSICYQIIKSMGGTIEISSVRMQGTSIKIALKY